MSAPSQEKHDLSAQEAVAKRWNETALPAIRKWQEVKAWADKYGIDLGKAMPLYPVE